MFHRRSLYAVVCLLTAVTTFGIIFFFGITSIELMPSRPASNYTFKEVRLDKADNVKPSIIKICERGKVKISKACLCYAEPFNETDVISTDGVNNTEIFDELNQIRCAMNFFAEGRLGNIMTQYATLYGLADMNKRPAFMSPDMTNALQKYFKVTIPAMSPRLYGQIKWKEIGITDWMQEPYRHMEGQFIQLRNYVPSSFQFYDHLREDIRREFQVKDDYKAMAQQFLHGLRGNRSSVTFVGVHVRRGDYVEKMKTELKGVVGDKNFFVNATKYFRDKYSDAIFVVASNDMKWCEENIANDKSDVFFAGNGIETSPIDDFAILVNCNHTIFTIGTFGHWVGYLTGGEVVYLANFTAPDSSYRRSFKTGNTFLSHWIPIEADLSPLYTNKT